jgi:hypothetical protein
MSVLLSLYYTNTDMAKQIHTSITIKASKEAVWEVFTDFESYPDWNPFIKSLKGEVAVGNTIAIQLPGMNFKPKVLTYTKNTELKWLGHLWFKGLFDGEHLFLLTDNGDGTTTLDQSEQFCGLLVGVFPKSLYTDTQTGFETMNEALKKRVEGIR